jgi:16S rRNA G1207 methylase RsmC
MADKITIFPVKEVKNFFNKKWGNKNHSNNLSMYLTKEVNLSLNSLLSKFIELTQPQNQIADLGCGDGRIILTLLKNKYKNIYATDYSTEAINRLNNLIKTKNEI